VPTVSPFEILDSARDLVARGWCQNTMAQDSHGAGVDPSSRHACAWSASGAVLAAWRSTCPTDEALDRAFTSLVHANLALAGSVPITPDEWNDANGRTQEQVLQAFDRAAVVLDWPPSADSEPRVVRIRRRLITHGRFDHSEAYDFSEPYEVVNMPADGQYVLRDRSGNVTIFQAGGLYADLESRCDACHEWRDHVAPTRGDASRWLCHGGAAPCGTART
jgi:hypothetical protein